MATAVNAGTEVYRGAEDTVDSVPKLGLDIVTADEDAADVIDVVVRSAAAGKIDVGKVWATSISDLVRIRTGERGDYAL